MWLLPRTLHDITIIIDQQEVISKFHSYRKQGHHSQGKMIKFKCFMNRLIEDFH